MGAAFTDGQLFDCIKLAGALKIDLESSDEGHQHAAFVNTHDGIGVLPSHLFYNLTFHSPLPQPLQY